MDTTDMCLELYYQSQSTCTMSKPVISVIAVDEEKDETKLASNEGLERTVWERLFAKLPNGVNQVVVEGLRSSTGYSSMSIDDIVVQPCEIFGIIFALERRSLYFTHFIIYFYSKHFFRYLSSDILVVRSPLENILGPFSSVFETMSSLQNAKVDQNSKIKNDSVNR